MEEMEGRSGGNVEDRRGGGECIGWKIEEMCGGYWKKKKKETEEEGEEEEVKNIKIEILT